MGSWGAYISFSMAHSTSSWVSAVAGEHRTDIRAVPGPGSESKATT